MEIPAVIQACGKRGHDNRVDDTRNVGHLDKTASRGIRIDVCLKDVVGPDRRDSDKLS